MEYNIIILFILYCIIARVEFIPKYLKYCTKITNFPHNILVLIDYIIM